MKKTISFLLALILISSLMLVAYAHPGNADWRGGHIDHSTGGYHYHHGYSAHQHKDMDGDGILDCPYNFEKRENQSSGSSYKSYRSLPSHTPAPTSKPLSFSYVADLIFSVLLAFGGFYLIFVGPVISLIKKRRQERKRAENIEKRLREERLKREQKD